MTNLKYIMVTFFLLTSHSQADVYHKFVDFTCIPEARYFKVSAVGIYNIDITDSESDIVKIIKNKSNLQYVYGGEVFKETCRVDDKEVEIDLYYRVPQPRGQCGGEERANLSVTIDGNTVIQNTRFHSLCFGYSLMELDFSHLEWGRFQVCGWQTVSNQNITKNVCVNINLKDYANGEIADIASLFQDAPR